MSPSWPKSLVWNIILVSFSNTEHLLLGEWISLLCVWDTITKYHIWRAIRQKPLLIIMFNLSLLMGMSLSSPQWLLGFIQVWNCVNEIKRFLAVVHWNNLNKKVFMLCICRVSGLDFVEVTGQGHYVCLSLSFMIVHRFFSSTFQVKGQRLWRHMTT